MTTAPRFDARIVLITGAASGIGLASARRFAAEGAKVVLADINLPGAGRAAADIRDGGGSAVALGLDVADAARWDDAVAACVSRFGGLDVLVNNAGFGDKGSIDDVTVDDYREVMKVTLDGVFYGMQAAGPSLKASDHGAVVNVSSIYGLVGGSGTSPAYHAAKGAVRTLTKNVAVAWAGSGVRVNSVHPGFIDTPLLEGAVPGMLEARTPLGRLGAPEEIASAIAFLASDDSSFMTGAELVVDGGFTAI